MGLSAMASDSVPTRTLTPQEPLVELLRVCMGKNCIPLLTDPSDKAFLITWLIREWAWQVRCGQASILLMVDSDDRADLWRQFLQRLTDVLPSTTISTVSTGLFVATPEMTANCLQDLRLCLLIVDNGHVLLDKPETKQVLEAAVGSDTRVVTLTANVLRDCLANEVVLARLGHSIGKLKSNFPGDPEATCDLLSVLRFIANPCVQIVQFRQEPVSTSAAICQQIEAIVANCMEFLSSHQYSLFETYGDEFSDLIETIPDPTEQPMRLLCDYISVLRSMGVWCAERAALLLIIKIDKLKTREKYERHFLLLSVLYTEMVKIRKFCETAFQGLTDKQKLTEFSTHKMLRLVDILRQYKPDHVASSSSSSGGGDDGETVTKPPPRPFQPRGRSNKQQGYSSYDDPNALCGVVFVNSRFSAKILYHFLKDLSRSDDAYSFLMPQYAVEIDDEDPFDVESERRKQEDALRRFRMRECNLLVSNGLLEQGIDSVRCNLIVSFDKPVNFTMYAHYKVKAKAPISNFLIFSPKVETEATTKALDRFKAVEDLLKAHCTFPGPTDYDTSNADKCDENSSWRTSMFVLNRYCAKLPSDTFTRLTPLYDLVQTDDSKYMCSIQLPINCPLKSVVRGPALDSVEIAKRAAAQEAVSQLQTIGELDDNMLPVGKDGPRNLPPPVLQPQPQPQPEKVVEVRESGARPGTTKRRQYYYKQVAKCLTHVASEAEDKYRLYALRMRLSCAIPDDQNTRGRRIYAPEESAQCFGILVQGKVPPVCQFPIYTRDGEVFVDTVLIDDDVHLPGEKMQPVLDFHKYTFSQVLRLEKYPMVFSPSDATNCVVVVPLRQDHIDWDFLASIDFSAPLKLATVDEDSRKAMRFKTCDYVDAVVMPWYRNQDQPQYFYVAEICDHLSPGSDFPGQGFESFKKYYEEKYTLKIQSVAQPLLDVDHTSARLNFLTPRYVNRKGVALPTSSEETKRSKRENLEQKQILVPELCTIHPFPASLWRQAVCLPCILYRLNGLLIADSLRVTIANEMSVGIGVNLADGFTWPALTFGWTLADVLKNRANQTATPTKAGGQPTNQTVKPSSRSKPGASPSEEPLGSLSCRLLNKLNEEESKLRKQSNLEIGMWHNEMAERNNPDDDEEEDSALLDDMLDPNVALPENLTFIDESMLPKLSGGGNRRDWGTGIAQKRYRVGSPTFLNNTNIHIPGLMDDMDGFSCSDSEDEFNEDDKQAQTETEDVGMVRIEFRGGHTAEAFEDQERETRRVEVLAKNKEEDRKMLCNWPWPHQDSDDSETAKNAWTIIAVDQDFDRFYRPSCGDQTVTTTLPVLANMPIADDKVTRCKANDVIGVIDVEDDVDSGFNFDYQPDLATHPGPAPSLLLQALTMSNSNDAINLERLETIGDSFLKYAITSYLFCMHPTIHEGRLSHLRSKQVSNLNLYRLGKKKRLGECMIATKFEPHDNWLPPCYHVPEELEQALIDSGVPASHWNVADLPDLHGMDCGEISAVVRQNAVAVTSKAVESMPSFVPYNLLTQHSIPDKSIADCVEALIGSYLISCGPHGALLFMTWLGLTVLPGNKEGLPQPVSPLVRPDGVKDVMLMLNGYDGFEKLIGYKFRDKSYLLQAFTHASYYPNRLTDCYQRLEFLGDAVLDYLITRHLFEDQRRHSPGALTDLRSALVNNTIFATLAVKYDFHKYFKHFSPGLQTVVNQFVKIQSEHNFSYVDDFYLIEEDDTDEAEDVEVPKALGDIFESVAGAIFLDSGLSLNAVWRVYYRMMKSSIDMYSDNVPKSPIREILELEPETAKFGKPEKLADGRRVRCSLEIIGKGVFKGIGRSYRIAKCTAAKCALRSLKR